MVNEHSSIKAIRKLINHGWLSLRQVAILLEYGELRGIYARQRGRNKIPTVRIGGIERVCAEDIVHILENPPQDKRDSYSVLLSIYRAGIKDRERRNRMGR